jgi:hypothetical protein
MSETCTKKWKRYYCSFIITVQLLLTVFRIRIRIRIRMFLGLLDPHPDPLVTSTAPALDPSYKSDERFEIMVAKLNFNAKIFCYQFV